MDMEAYYHGILLEELVPATGCTEPIAVALAAAVAKKALGQMPQKVRASCSGNVIKNVKGVVVPGTGGLKGIQAAVASGLVAGNPDAGLEAIASISEEERAAIQALNETDFCPVTCLHGVPGLEIRIWAGAGEDYSEVTIKGGHTNVTCISKNGRTLLDKSQDASTGQTGNAREAMTVDGIYAYAARADLSPVMSLLREQARVNYEIAAEGFNNSYGATIGRLLLSSGSDDIYTRCAAYAAAGSDARMSGCAKSVMTCCGSGNQGITCSLPVILFSRENKAHEETTLRALALSNLVAVHVKQQMGKLSAFCGVVCAAAGAVSGIAFLEGHGETVISDVIANQLALISGMVCDGAKPSCAGKIAVAMSSAFLGYRLALEKPGTFPGDGLISPDIEQTIGNVSRLARDGMRTTDVVVLDIMTGG